MHQLLKRQLRKHYPNAPLGDPEFEKFVQIISNTYDIYEQEIEFSNQSFTISEREFKQANARLEKQAIERKDSIDKLKETLVKTGLSESTVSVEDDLFNISSIIEKQVENTIQIDKELKYNIQRLNTLINNHPSAILVETENRRIAYTNQAFCNTFQIPVEPKLLLGADCSESAEQSKHMFVNEAGFVARIEELLSKKKPVTNELLYLKDGRILERSFIPIIIENRYTGHFWSYDDVTERKQIEKDLIEKEKSLLAIFNSSLDGIVNINSNHKVVFWNPSAERIFGWTKEEAMNKDLNELFIPPDYRDSHTRFLTKVLAGEDHPVLNSVFERPGIDKNGKHIDLEISIAFVFVNNEKSFSYFLRDISERKMNDTKLRKSEEKYRNIIENINLGLIEYDKNLNILYTNDTYSKISGYSKDELLGANALELFKNQPNIGVFMNKISDRLKGISDIYEVDVIDKKNDHRTWLSSGSPVTNMEGEMVGFVGIHLDITAQKVTERKITENESRFRLILNSALDAIINIDHRGLIIFWNPKAESLFGWTESEVLGKPLSDIIVPQRHRENHNKGIDTYNEDSKGPILNKLIELPALTRDGKELIVELSITPIKVGNEFIYCSFIRDISDRIKSQRALAKSEEKYKRIIANMNLGLLEVDNNDMIQYVNNSFLKLSGYKRHELLNKKAGEIFMRGQNYEAISQKITHRQEGISDVYELSVFNKDNEIRWWLISGAPNIDENGKVVGSIGIHLDITRQKETEHQLSLAKEIAEKSSKAKETFLTNMSHEIRTPLHGIIGMIREIAKEELSSNQMHLLSNAQTASNHLLSIINNILDISKIESGEFKLNMQHFSIHEEINGVIRILLNKAHSKNLLLVQDVDKSLAEAFIGDSAIFRQILLNLVGNSIKFSEKGIIKIACKVIQANESNQELEFKISDQGIGMDEEYLKNLFKKFHQEDISNTRKFGGSGLGLAITKELIELMNGHVEVRSQKYIGTDFIFTINFQIGDSRLIQNIENKDVFEVLRKKKILLVEDNPMNSLVTSNALKPYDVSIVEATDGSKAIEILYQEKFDIILMDIQMPVMDGIEATKIIRQQLHIDTPIIALTANAFKTELDKCKDAGMNTYVTKPFEEKELLNTICNELARSINMQFEYVDIDSIEEELEELQATKPKNETHYYKLDYLIETSRGNENFVTDMLKLFLTIIPSSIEQMEQAMNQSNIDELKGVVHKLKPSINNLRIPLTNQIKTIEGLSVQQGIDSNIQKVVSEIAETLMLCMNEIKENEGF